MVDFSILVPPPPFADQSISLQVLSYTGEKKSVAEYDRSISKAEKLGIRSGAAAGFGLGFAVFVMFASYALAMWYGSVLVINDGLSGGSVLSVVFAVVIGGR